MILLPLGDALERHDSLFRRSFNGRSVVTLYMPFANGDCGEMGDDGVSGIAGGSGRGKGRQEEGG